MPTYRLNDEVFAGDSEELNAQLAAAHTGKIRPFCLCVSGGVEMYIASIGDKFIIKRMPGSGSNHHADCASYESPIALNGRGAVDGSAIQEDIDSGLTTLRFDFALAKSQGGKAPPPPGAQPDSVSGSPTKLSLRGLLHFLWEEAGFNRWSPAMADKRNWSVIRKYLYEAVELSRAKGSPLAEFLFIPESFRLEEKEKIASRRTRALAALYAKSTGPRPLRILIGEVNRIEPTRFGKRLIVKHLPDYHFFMDESLGNKLLKAFGPELEMWGTEEGAHLVAIASFGISLAGNPTLELISLCLFDENWLPIEDVNDAQLTRELVRAKRRFVKGLRYNLKKDTPISTALLNDTQDKPTALFVVPPDASDDYLAQLAQVREDLDLPTWIWNVGESGLPALPAPQSSQRSA